jgi:beta-glucosidase/6-phospho-beta-glucosidase/beta-galactosidase
MRWFWLLIAMGCRSVPPVPDVEPLFPENFQWGTATAGFQVDMGCPTWSAERCEDRASDWYQWVTDESIIATNSLFVTGEPVSAGPGMWELFESDVAQMELDGMSAYRLSLEWSRLFPDGAAEQAQSVNELGGYADQEAVARYHEFFTALAQANIEPLVTLNHYTLPLWVHDGVACHEDPEGCVASGWVDAERITRLIGLYAGYAGQEFGSEVDQWATLNEPFATTLSGYAFPGPDRSAPPGLSLDIPKVVLVMHNQILGHGEMFYALKANDQTDASGDGVAVSVGIVMNMMAILPRDASVAADVRAADHMDYLYHRLYLDALTAGAWDADLDGVVDSTKLELANTLDFIGVNYYNRVEVTGFPFPLYDDIPVFDFYPEFSWDPYPEGLAQVLDSAWEYGLPLYVTENGTPYVVERGSEVLEGHLRAVESSLEAGVDVRGYYYWSYVDNYEWNHGFDLRFGLYELDPSTKERIPRAVRDTYAAIIERGRVEPR